LEHVALRKPAFQYVSATVFACCGRNKMRPAHAKDSSIMKKSLALLLLLGIAPVWATPKLDGGPFQGEVLESINAGSYTYLRLKTMDGEVWAATMQATYAKGAHLQLHDPMLMTDFESKALGRTFPEIVFASAVSTEGQDMATPMQQMTAAHKGTATAGTSVPVPKVTKAAGPSGRTVAEVYAQKSALSGKNVAVRGTVVKFNSGILDRNWIHLRDGSGSATDATNDLLVTTDPKLTAKVGDVIVVSGPVKTNVDYGSGYAYPVLIEGAALKN
jgi:hypothetical protein